MRTFFIFYAIGFLLLGGIGFVNAWRDGPPAIEQRAMDVLEPVTLNGHRSLLGLRDPGTHRLTALYDYASSRFIITPKAAQAPGKPLLSDENIETLSTISGTSLALNIRTLMSRHSTTRFFSRLSGKSRSSRILGTLAGAISGYSAGSHLGRHPFFRDDSAAIDAFLAKEKSWTDIGNDYALYRLDKLQEAVNDLPAIVADEYTLKINAAEEKIAAQRAASKSSLEAELALVLGLEKASQPHFTLTGNYKDQSRDKLDTALTVGKWMLYAMLAFIVLAFVAGLGQKIMEILKK